MPTVAIASEFLEAYAKIPKAQQRKVREFTEKFRANPTQASINYEKINGVRDKKVRTVRIDQKYRAVILHPESGEVHVLMWVDNHDEAMNWAMNRSFDINPVTGAFQVVNFMAAQPERPPSQKRKGGRRAYCGAIPTTCCSHSACPSCCCRRSGPCIRRRI